MSNIVVPILLSVWCSLATGFYIHFFSKVSHKFWERVYQRSFFLLTCEFFFAIWASVAQALAPFACHTPWTQIFLFIPIPSYTLALFMRLIRYNVRMKNSGGKISLVSEYLPSIGLEYSNVHYFQKENLFSRISTNVFLFGILFHTVLGISLAFTTKPLLNCSLSSNGFWVQDGLVLIYCAGLIFGMRRVRELKDDFKIKFEVLIQSIIIVSSFVIEYLIFHLGSNDQYTSAVSIIDLIRCVLVLSTTLYCLYHNSEVHQRVQKKGNSNSIASHKLKKNKFQGFSPFSSSSNQKAMQKSADFSSSSPLLSLNPSEDLMVQYLENPSIKSLLLEFSVQSLCPESILFYSVEQEYRKNPNHKVASEILKLFIFPSGDLALNLTGPVTEKVFDSLNDLKPNLFQEALDEVKYIIITDIWPRFLQSRYAVTARNLFSSSPV